MRDGQFAETQAIGVATVQHTSDDDGVFHVLENEQNPVVSNARPPEIALSYERTNIYCLWVRCEALDC